jgi:hypothetical protein
MRKVYRTVKEARNALALDTGFDPFHTGYVKGRCTKIALARLGYPVDKKLAEQQAAERRRKLLTSAEAESLLRPVGRCAKGHMWSVDQHGRDCPECGGPEIMDMECDNGHKWKAAYNAGPESDKCPKCGEYYV